MNLTKAIKFSFLILISFSLFLFSGCFNSVRYLKSGTFKKPNIWEKVIIKESKLSPDQKKIFSENGNPSYILIFPEARSDNENKKPVHEWVYEKEEKFFWFVDGSLVDY